MPASWELVQARKDAVLVAILLPPDTAVTMEYTQTLRSLVLPPGSDFMRVAGLPFGPARNAAAKAALDSGRHLFFLDADVRVQDPNCIIRMLETGLPYLSALYYQRFHPYMPVMFNDQRDEKGIISRVPIVGWQPGQIVPATFVPTGMLLIRHSLLKQMFERLKAPFFWGVDVAPPIDQDIGGPALGMSEDFSASFKVKYILGVQPYVITSQVGLHETRAVVGPRWMLQYPSNDPYHGVIAVL